MPDLPPDFPPDPSSTDDPAFLSHAIDDYASLHGEDAAGLGL